MKEQLFIRADATSGIGIGHIMRCVALAQAWKDQGGDVTFLSYCDNCTICQRIEKEGFKFVPIEKPHPDLSDFDQTMNILQQFENPASKNWLVIDGYHFTSDYQKKIKMQDIYVLIIDDFAHLNHYHANLLLNQNINAFELSYPCDKDTIKLLGCQYALLRREFLDYKEWARTVPTNANNIIITMGGADPSNETLKIIQALNHLKESNLKIKIIVGPVNPHIKTLEIELKQSIFKFDLLANVTEMPKLMAWADIAISAAGSSCWELAFMGLPMILIITADNQKGIAAGLDASGAAMNLGWFSDVSTLEIASKLKKLKQDSNLIETMQLQGKKKVDGDGVQRVIAEMIKINT